MKSQPVQTISGLLESQKTGTGANGLPVISVDMGPARLDWRDIPLARACDTNHMPVGAGPLQDAVGTSMGNPHATFFVDDLSKIPLAELGPRLEHDPFFPERANIGVAQMIARARPKVEIFCFGTRLSRVTRTLKHRQPDEALARLSALVFDFDGGTRASYCATYDSVGNEFFERGNRFYLRMLGERGTLSVWQRWAFLCLRGRIPRLVARGRREVTEEVALLRQLELAVGSKEEPECSGRDNLRTVAVLEACARLAAEGRWVDPRELLREPI